MRLKAKHIQSPWITKETKRKQKFLEKFLKHRTRETELSYKSYKNIFENIKKKSMKKCYDAKKTWSIMKKLTVKKKLKSSNFLRETTVNEVDIFDECKVITAFFTIIVKLHVKIKFQML